MSPSEERPVQVQQVQPEVDHGATKRSNSWCRWVVCAAGFVTLVVGAGLYAHWAWRTSTSTGTRAEDPPCLGSACKDGLETTLSFGVSQDSINKFIPGVVNNLFPALTDYVNAYAGAELSADAKAGSCCNFGNVGVDAEVHVAGFTLRNPSTDQIQVSLFYPPQDEYKNRMIGLKVRADNLNAAFTSVGASVGLAVVVPITCHIEVVANVHLPHTEIDLLVGLGDDGKTFTIHPGSVSFPGSSLLLLPSAHFDLCAPVSVIAGMMATVFTSIATDIWQAFYPKLQNAMSEALVKAIGTPSFAIPNIPPISIASEGELQIWPDIRTFWQAPFSPTGLVAEGLLHVRATKHDGSTFEGPVPPPMASQTVPLPSPLDHLVMVNLGASITQKIVDAIWWMLVDPFQQELPEAIADVVKLLFMDFHDPSITITLPSPSIVFEMNSIRADVALEAVVSARSTNLILVNSTLSFPMDIPTYNPSNGTFGGLAFHNTSISELRITTPTKPNHGDNWERQLNATLVPFLNEKANNMIFPRVNDAIASALAQIPLEIPAIEKFPAPNVDMKIDITELIFGASSGPTDRLMGYADGAGNLEISFPTRAGGSGASKFLPHRKPVVQVDEKDFCERTLSRSQEMKADSQAVLVSCVGPTQNLSQVLV